MGFKEKMAAHLGINATPGITGTADSGTSEEWLSKEDKNTNMKEKVDAHMTGSK